ncbi:MAG: CesT family type III secretion system chaperone, partial [Pseudomonadota bacterium]
RIDPPAVDADGRRFVVFDGLYELALFQLGEQLYLSAPIGALPVAREARQDALDHLLGLQMARAGHGAEVMSIEPDDGELMLFRTLPARHVTAASFEAALSSFVSTLEFWTKQLQRRSAGAERPAPPALQIMYP